MITTEQQLMCERLYKAGDLTIKQIMRETGIRSEQTIYRILDAAGIPRRPTRKTGLRATISFDEHTAEIINRVNPANLSQWICELIRDYEKGLKH